MISSPEDPPERNDGEAADLPPEQVDTRAPQRDQVSRSPETAEDPQIQYALSAARLHARLLREAGVDLVGVYVVGSTPIGDRWPHSDVDTVTVTRQPVTDEELLRRVHDRLTEEFSGTYYDTTYVPHAWLAEPPEHGAAAPHSMNGQLAMDTSAPVHPVAWLELATSLTADGEPVESLAVKVDLDEVSAYTRANLSSYWVQVADSLRAAAQTQSADAPLTNPYPVVWTVLGAPRLAAMLDRIRRWPPGPLPRLVSKSEAGDWVRTHLPQYADLAERALADRHGQPASFTVADATAAADLVHEVVVVSNSR